MTGGGKLLGRFKQSHNDIVIEVTERYFIYQGKAYNLTWIEEHSFYIEWQANEFWYYIRNVDKYEAIKYIGNTGYHTLIPL